MSTLVVVLCFFVLFYRFAELILHVFFPKKKNLQAGVFSLLEATEYLLNKRGVDFQPPRTIYFAFGHDEETGGNVSFVQTKRKIRLW